MDITITMEGISLVEVGALGIPGILGIRGGTTGSHRGLRGRTTGTAVTRGISSDSFGSGLIKLHRWFSRRFHQWLVEHLVDDEREFGAEA